MKLLVKCSKIIGWFLAGLGVLAISGLLYQYFSERSGASPPPGQLVSVDGRALHLYCTGEGSPTVILESGGSTPSVTSRHVQRLISNHTHVCAYDRAGYGYSDPVNEPRTFDDLSRDLKLALDQGQILGPYILVGESMGGLIVRNFYTLYPMDIAGILLLDAAEEEHTFARIEMLEGMQSSAAVASALARFGVLRLMLNLAPEQFGMPPDLDKESREEIIAQTARPSHFKAAKLELNAYFATPPEKREASGFGALDSIPLIVVRHGIPMTGAQSFLEEGWEESQHRLAELSTDSRIVVAEESGHAISIEQPELVEELVVELLQRSRN